MTDKEKIKQIIPLRESGMNNLQISKKLEMNRATVNYWVKALKKRGYNVPKIKMGRPFKEL